MATSSVRLDGDTRKLLRQLKRLAATDETLRTANRVLAQTVKASTQLRFQREESPEGQSWEPSARSIQEGGKTLSDKRSLYKSIHARSTLSGFAVGTDKIYGATHQYGDERTIRAKSSKGLRFFVGGRWVNKNKVVVVIPARPYLGLSEQDMRDIKDTLIDLMEA